MELDLHGVKHVDVGQIVDAFIWEHMQRGSIQVTIITGKSENMKKLVRERADEYGMTCRNSIVNDGVVFVDLK